MSRTLWALSILSFILFAGRSARAEIAGRIRVGEDHFLKKQIDPVASDEGSLGLELEAKHNFSESWRLRFEPKVRLSTADHIVDAPIDGDLRDTQFEGKFGNYHFQGGTFIKVWEGTDGLNPMDIASMKNYRDPLASESLSSLGITMAGGEGFFTWDVLYVPRQTPSRLPGEKSPWLPRQATLPLEKDTTQLLVPAEPRYEILDREEHDHALDHNVGLRLQLHGKSWDFSLAGFEGAAQTPYLLPIVSGTAITASPGHTTIQMNNPIQIRPIDYRRRTIAGALVYTRDTWIFRLAGNHDQPIGDNPIEEISATHNTNPADDPALPSWSEQFVAGLEKTVTIREQTVIFSLQGSYGQSPESSSLMSAADIFRRAVLAGFRWPWSDELTFGFAALYNTEGRGEFGRLSAQKKLNDPTTLEIYAEGLDGPDDSLLGVLRDQKRAGVSLTYQF
jgi:hypothetical protein